MFKKGPFIVGMLSLLIATPGFAAKSGWVEDFAKAKSDATTQKKHVLLDFTGSDWCGWCQKIDKDVFAKGDFKEFAKEKLILVEVDFPQSKSLPPAVKAQNEKMKDAYNVQGFPTLVLLDAGGKEVKRWGGVFRDLF